MQCEPGWRAVYSDDVGHLLMECVHCWALVETRETRTRLTSIEACVSSGTYLEPVTNGPTGFIGLLPPGDDSLLQEYQEVADTRKKSHR